MATVIDFQTHTTAVERAIAHFRREVRPHLGDIDDLIGLLDRWAADQPGNTALAEYLWGYKMWSRAQIFVRSAAGSTAESSRARSLLNWRGRE